MGKRTNREEIGGGTAPGLPSVRFAAEGAKIDGYLVDHEEVHGVKYGTDDLEYWDNDKKRPKMTDVYTVMLAAATAGIEAGSSAEGYENPGAGDLVRIWVRGPLAVAWGKARRAIAVSDGGPYYGDRVRVARRKDQPANNPKHNDRHDYRVRFEAADDTERWPKAALAARRELREEAGAAAHRAAESKPGRDDGLDDDDAF